MKYSYKSTTPKISYVYEPFVTHLVSIKVCFALSMVFETVDIMYYALDKI